MAEVSRFQKGMAIRASSLIEVIVASLIFLTVFAVSLHTIVSMTVRTNDDTAYILADLEVKKIYNGYRAGEQGLSGNKFMYPWGEIETRLGPYGEYYGITELTVRVRFASAPGEIEYKYLFEKRDEDN